MGGHFFSSIARTDNLPKILRTVIIETIFDIMPVELFWLIRIIILSCYMI